MSIVIAEGYVTGCIGAITHLHATYYAAASGFGAPFEAKVAGELAAFVSGYEPGRDGLWLASDGGEIVGSIVIDGRHADTEGAHLRWFITGDRARGRGMGRALLQTALAFADARNYRCVYLWTFAGLAAARQLYERNGFRLVRESPGDQWGRVVNEQYFRRGGD